MALGCCGVGDISNLGLANATKGILRLWSGVRAQQKVRHRALVLSDVRLGGSVWTVGPSTAAW